MISLLVLAQLTIGSIALKPADYLDGRAIAGGTGAPVVMLTLTSSAAKRIATSGPVLLDGAAVVTRVTDGVIEIDGQPDFAAAKALALSYDQLRHALRRHGLLEKANDATRP